MNDHILAVHEGLQHQEERCQNAVMPGRVLDLPVVADMQPKGSHPLLVLGHFACAIDRATSLCNLSRASIAHPHTAKTGCCVVHEQQLGHCDHWAKDLGPECCGRPGILGPKTLRPWYMCDLACWQPFLNARCSHASLMIHRCASRSGRLCKPEAKTYTVLCV